MVEKGSEEEEYFRSKVTNIHYLSLQNVCWIIKRIPRPTGVWNGLVAFLKTYWAFISPCFFKKISAMIDNNNNDINQACSEYILWIINRYFKKCKLFAKFQKENNAWDCHIFHYKGFIELCPIFRLYNISLVVSQFSICNTKFDIFPKLKLQTLFREIFCEKAASWCLACACSTLWPPPNTSRVSSPSW